MSGGLMPPHGGFLGVTSDGGTIGGTLAATEVAFGTGANIIGGESAFTYIIGTNTLNVDNIILTTLQTDADNVTVLGAGTQLLVESGNASAAAPQLARAGDTGTGLLWDGSLRAIHSGNIKMIWNATGVLVQPGVSLLAALAAGNGLKYNGDTNTGWERVAADEQDGIAGGQVCITLQEVGDAPLVGLYGVAAVVQHATTGQTAGSTTGVGNNVNDDSTFTGGSGTAAYTIGDLVLMVKNLGIAAAS